ncbi:MAG TPA: DMT family transporter, partial [Aliiroseovarius sp.]|nr:DMT family transporter [Aliiroseovarius sp.]
MIQAGGASEMRQGCQRHIIRRILAQTAFVCHPAHIFLPALKNFCMRHCMSRMEKTRFATHWSMGETNRVRENMQQDRPMLAVALILVAMLMLGLFDNFIGLIARDIGLWQFHFMRALLAMGGLAALAALGLINLRAKRRWAVALRGGFTALSMLIYFGSLAFLSVAETAAGLFSAPIWVLLLSTLFLGARPRPVQIGAALVGFAGVLLVLDPFAQGLRLVSFLPVLAGMFYAIGSIATRQFCEGEGIFAMLLWFFLMLPGMGAAGLVALHVWPQDVPAGEAGFILRGWVWPVSPTAAWLTLMQAVAA